MLVSTIEISRNHQGRNLSEPAFNWYNWYKLLGNQYLTDVMNAL